MYVYLSQAVKLHGLVKGSGLINAKQLSLATSDLLSCLRHLYKCVWIPNESKKPNKQKHKHKQNQNDNFNQQTDYVAYGKGNGWFRMHKYWRAIIIV